MREHGMHPRSIKGCNTFSFEFFFRYTNFYFTFQNSFKQKYCNLLIDCNALGVAFVRKMAPLYAKFPRNFHEKYCCSKQPHAQKYSVSPNIRVF